MEDPMPAPAAAALLVTKILLGQVYPSGHVYLQAFAPRGTDAARQAERPSLETWPAAVSVLCFDPAACLDKDVGEAPRAATRERYFDPDQKDVKAKEGEALSLHYIPGLEGLDETHNEPCRLPYAKNKDLRYATDGGGDFFSTMGDHCFSEEVVALYQMPEHPKSAAYEAIAVASELALTDVRRYAAGDVKHPNPKRPVSKADQTLVKAQKQKLPKDFECSTVPGYVTDARVQLEAKLKGRKESIRISMYSDPGCAGHLGTVYVLDVLAGGKVLATAELGRYIGVL
jgi:hypothetical protein